MSGHASGFQHVDASALGVNGIDATGNGLDTG